MDLTDTQLANVMTGKESVELDGYRLGFRVVRPDLRSKHDYRYPWPGNWAEATGTTDWSIAAGALWDRRARAFLAPSTPTETE